MNQLGSVTTAKATDAAFNSMLATAGMVALPLTLIILLLVFGSAVAALVPLLLAITAVIATTALIALPSQIVPFDESIGEVILLIGLAVGIDYSLFYLRREREERAAGRSEHAALEAAAATSGRAVADLGHHRHDRDGRHVPLRRQVVHVLLDRDDDGRRGRDDRLADRAAGAARQARRQGREGPDPVPAPAQAQGRREPLLGRDPQRRAAPPGRLGGRRGRRARRADGAGVLRSNTTTTGLDDISIPEIEPLKKFDAAFPGGNDPAQVAIKADDVRAEPVQNAIAELKRQALATGQMSGPIEVEASRDNTVATVDITLAGSGTDAESQAALATLREEVVPHTIGKVEGVEYAVGGTTAVDKDWETSIKTSAPLVFGFVLVFAFLILLASFRSIVVAIKAILLNLLSVGAAYGILVATFQWGWGENLLNFESNGGITPWLPMFLFVILFGLSMDYHVFILSRVREAYDRGLSNEDAVAYGIKSSAGVVTSAAVVMVGTFSVFALLPVIDMKEMGIGLAAAVLIDATLIRAVLLPATMKLLGDRNWYLPSWLEWLPRLEQEPAPRSRRLLPEAA